MSREQIIEVGNDVSSSTKMTSTHQWTWIINHHRKSYKQDEKKCIQAIRSIDCNKRNVTISYILVLQSCRKAMLVSRCALPDIYVPPSLYKSYAAYSGDSPKYTVFHWTWSRILLDLKGFAPCDPQMCQTSSVSNLTAPTSQSNVLEVV